MATKAKTTKTLAGQTKLAQDEGKSKKADMREGPEDKRQIAKRTTASGKGRSK